MKYILFLAILTVVNALCSIPLYAGRDECDDIKMLSQCQQAQMQINEYTNYVINDNYILVKYIPELHCENHISCKIAYDYDYCQNMDSYDTCVDSRKLLQEFIKKSTIGNKNTANID